METINVKIQVYKYDDLPEATKQVVAGGVIEFFCGLDYASLSKEMRKAVIMAEQMQTPWFVGSYMWDYAQKEIEDECRSYEYHKDGTLNHYVDGGEY